MEVAAGRAAFEGVPAEWQYNPLGTVHGGWLSALLDSALGCAVHTVLPAGRGYTTLDLHVRFVEFNADGLMARRLASINDLPIAESQR
jgi:uncharacterized protein (TIGR00369 family)